jgi:hypothetical protein
MMESELELRWRGRWIPSPDAPAPYLFTLHECFRSLIEAVAENKAQVAILYTGNCAAFAFGAGIMRKDARFYAI